MMRAKPIVLTTIGVLLAAVITMSLGGGATRAHEGATGIVAERMEMMKSLGDAMKRLASMYRGEAPYHPASVRDAAGIIGRHGGEQMTRMFPPGSHAHPSEALPEIWEDWERFQELAEEMTANAAALADAADQGDTGGDAAALPSRRDFARLGRVCSACHTEFRKED